MISCDNKQANRLYGEKESGLKCQEDFILRMRTLKISLMIISVTSAVQGRSPKDLQTNLTKKSLLTTAKQKIWLILFIQTYEEFKRYKIENMRRVTEAQTSGNAGAGNGCGHNPAKIERMMNMKKTVFNPKVGDWIVNNISTYVILEIIAQHTRDDETVVYNLSLKNVNTGWRFQAFGVEMLDDETVTWICSNYGFFDKPVDPAEVTTPLFASSDDEIVVYILKKLSRLVRLEADAEYWFTQVVSSTDEVEKRRADGFYQMMLIEYTQEKGRVRKSLMTDDKAALFPQRFNYLWNKSIGIIRHYAIARAKAMREANGIFSNKGLVEYKLFEEEDEK